MKNWNVSFEATFLQKSMSGQAFLPTQGEEGIDKLKSFIKDLLSEQKRETAGFITNEIITMLEDEDAVLPNRGDVDGKIINIRDNYLN